MSGKILFIHGFASCGSGAKATALRTYFGTRALVSPDLEFDPAKAIATLEQILSTRQVGLVIGSSLGGFFAVWLNRRQPVPTVLINPAMQPWHTLAPWIGTNRHWCTGRLFELTVQHLGTLRTMARTPDPAHERYLVLLGGRDELLDHRDAARRFASFDVRIERCDDHRFRRLESYLPLIARFRDSWVGEQLRTN